MSSTAGVIIGADARSVRALLEAELGAVLSNDQHRVLLGELLDAQAQGGGEAVRALVRQRVQQLLGEES